MTAETVSYVTTRDIIIPAGTELKPWKGTYEAVIGITKDSCAYFYMDDADIEESLGFAKKKSRRKATSKG